MSVPTNLLNFGQAVDFPLLLGVTLALFGAASYILGVVKVRRRGDSWSWFRAVNWMIGLVILTYITSGPPSVYGRVLFSAHMVDHMALTMVAPLFLVLGSPVTLALRALPSRGEGSRGDGSRGLREWILVFVHSKFSQVVTHPLFAAANFAGSIVLFYFSDAFGWAMRQHVGHELMNLHFVLHHGTNAHHIAEGVFKAAARTLRQATAIDPRQTGVPSSKGTLTD